MSVKELITEKVSSLPDVKQHEVLDFVEFLLQKDYEAKPDQAIEEWNEASLILAMQGLENDNLPDYTLADLKERWQ